MDVQSLSHTPEVCLKGFILVKFTIGHASIVRNKEVPLVLSVWLWGKETN
jgi:hypothetical protein